MQFTSSVLVSLLAITGSLAAPTKRTPDAGKLEVRLEAETFFLHVPLSNYQADQRFLGDRFTSVNFKSIEVLNGGLATPRCKVIDQAQKEIIAKRGDNIDTSFSDAGKGKWTFKDGPTGVGALKCDPAFTANNLNVQFIAAPPAGDAKVAVNAAVVDPTASSTTTAAATATSAL
ncbi:uncharacterized protein AB675_7687 [Cyphellophora attinorum]|uniref:AA1-like domain-containing protein n=1 Tax=Cyphellophora attinorum TaxID=1664694 RepID=A0A0N1HUD4_9EURO|nr:uncharacterized protein AB675_7687 [Phialophora attinorum]KPI40503.1 hypothetical protein AB675_7687 [Phialophora attinorum]